MNPRRQLAKLREAEYRILFNVVKEVLSQMTAAGGRDTEKDIFAKPGGYRSILSAKTYKDPCPHCGAKIIREAYMGGNVYYCENCQKNRD